MRIALAIYGVLNAILYASLLPLWDGFDEPFHYGYVQTLARHGTLPKLGETFLSEEIWESLSRAPASARVKQNLPLVTTFDEYFRLLPAARAELRASLSALPPALGDAPTRMLNYEAQHPPLAYAPLALADLLLKDQPLLLRVWLLRLICAISAVLATVLVASRLAAQLGVPAACANAVLFVVFSSQMFYGATAHVANDWLAIPLFALVITTSLDLYRNPSARSAFAAALTLAAGLLTKSYFLALLPLTCGVLLALAVRRRLESRIALVFTAVLLTAAGPWYARNLVLYDNLPGMQESAGGVPVAAIASAAFEMPWLRALVATAHGALWTGNNSFTAFSASTSFAMLGLAALGLLAYAVQWKQSTTSERITLTGCLCYVAALSYAALLIFLNTQGESVAPPSWHVQALLIPGWSLTLIGLSRAGWFGRVAIIAITWSWAYLLSCTYFVKLIPLYAGYPEPSVRLARLVTWYRAMAGQSWEVLNNTAIMPAAFLFTLAALIVSLAAGIASVISART